MNAPTLTSLSEDSGKSDTIIMPQSLWQMLHKLVSNLSLDMQTNGIKFYVRMNNSCHRGLNEDTLLLLFVLMEWNWRSRILPFISKLE